VAVTGEGSDEWLAGYPWYKANRLLGYLNAIPGLRLGRLVRRLYVKRLAPPGFNWRVSTRLEAMMGGSNPWVDIYGLMSLSKLRFFSRQLIDSIGDRLAYEDILPNSERFQRWHPLNRAIYIGGRVMLAGLLLNAKGDRVAMNSSVETRYPFLDEDVFSYLAPLHPRWKLHGLKDKYILRRMAERWLPHSVAWRRKAMFRAPLDSFHREPAPPFVDQLLSEESIRKTGLFSWEAVQKWRKAFRDMWPGSPARATVEMGLVGVIGTQLWYHTFIDGSLSDLPSGVGRWHLDRKPSPPVWKKLAKAQSVQVAAQGGG
jgi:asparagine synthase (glutamine-hydrolysing)